MEDNLKKIKKNKDYLKKNEKWRRPKKKIKKNLFSIPLKFRGKPFLGLAQLSKIFLDIITTVSFGIIGNQEESLSFF